MPVTSGDRPRVVPHTPPHRSVAPPLRVSAARAVTADAGLGGDPMAGGKGCASAASRDLPPEGQPPRWHRLTWAFILAIVALSLMYIGGLKVLQAASVLVGLPLLFVMIVMMLSLNRLLRGHGRDPGRVPFRDVAVKRCHN